MDTADPTEDLPAEVRAAARVDPNGEVAWPRAVAALALDALAAQGAIVLGLDLRRYGSTGDVFEVAWTSFNEQQDPDASGLNHRAALEGIRRADADPTVDDLAWVLVTWVSANGTAP